MTSGTRVGFVVGNTSPHEFNFYLAGFKAKLGDLVAVEMTIPAGDDGDQRAVNVWARIVDLARSNPFLPAEAGSELAEEGLELTDTVLSVTRDQIQGKALVLGYADGDSTNLQPLTYPVQPGAEIKLPPPATVQSILVGDEKDVERLHLGTLIGRRDIEVGLKANRVVARHMAILAMTGGGKTVAARRVMRELMEKGFPLVVLDPHGDYLNFWSQREALFPDNTVKLFYPHLRVKPENIDLIGYLITTMTQGLSDAQREVFHQALEKVPAREQDVQSFIDALIGTLDDVHATHRGTVPAVKRQLRLVKGYFEAMETSNEKLRRYMKDFDFEAMPDPKTDPGGFVSPGQMSIVYLGGYDHLTQSTVVSVILKELFDHRASMNNRIPPFMGIIEEAHNFIPSHGEGQGDTPSVATIRKVITEGRKFGTGLLLISQRPSRLDETTLSQCNTFLIFRLVNPKDLRFVENVMENLTKEDSRLIPGFGPGQGIISGQAVRFPLTIRVKFDEDLVPKEMGTENFLGAVREWKDSPEAKTHDRTKGLVEALHEGAEKKSKKKSQ